MVEQESAPFKLSHEMTELLDPGRTRASPQYAQFEELCVRAYLAVRLYPPSLHGVLLRGLAPRGCVPAASKRPILWHQNSSDDDTVAAAWHCTSSSISSAAGHSR